MKLKKSTNTTGTKVARSVADKVEVLRLITNEGLTSREALERVFEGAMSMAMSKYPGSEVHRYRQSIEKALAKGDQQTIELLKEADLIEQD